MDAESSASQILETADNPYFRVDNNTIRGRNSSGDSLESATAPVEGNQPIEDKYTHRDIIRIALVMSPLWFLANCLYNYSLLATSVGSSTIIR